MNKPLNQSDLATPKVTTGPLTASRKVYSRPDSAPDLRVPVREIALTDPNEPALPVYDTTGPYTDNDAAIDVEQGLKRARTEWVKERGGVEEYDGRPIQPIDNGNATGKHLARAFANTPKPLRGIDASITGDLSSPPPLRGRSASEASREGDIAQTSTPLPNPPPQGGREPLAARDRKSVV